MGAAHTRTHQWAHTNRPERIRPRADAQASKRHTAGMHQPRRLANENNANSHTTVTSRAACPIKMLQPATGCSAWTANQGAIVQL